MQPDDFPESALYLCAFLGAVLSPESCKILQFSSLLVSHWEQKRLPVLGCSFSDQALKKRWQQGMFVS